MLVVLSVQVSVSCSTPQLGVEAAQVGGGGEIHDLAAKLAH